MLRCFLLQHWFSSVDFRPIIFLSSTLVITEKQTKIDNNTSLLMIYTFWIYLGRRLNCAYTKKDNLNCTIRKKRVQKMTRSCEYFCPLSVCDGRHISKWRSSKRTKWETNQFKKYLFPPRYSEEGYTFFAMSLLYILHKFYKHFIV